MIGAISSRTTPTSFVATAQCGGHGTETGGCETPTPVPPTNMVATHSSERPRGNQSGRVPGDAGDLGSGLATGLMALGVGLLFWLRMR